MIFRIDGPWARQVVSPVVSWSIAINFGYKYYYWLVVLTILKNMSKSMGRIIPHIMENKIHV